MNARTDKYLQLLLSDGGIAAVLLGGIVIASVAYAAQGFGDVAAPAELSAAAVAPASVAPVTRAHRCDECGVIESVRKIEAAHEITALKSPGRVDARSRDEIEAEPLGNYAITIRMQDGSMRVIHDAKPAVWRHGEPVTIIAGVD